MTEARIDNERDTTKVLVGGRLHLGTEVTRRHKIVYRHGVGKSVHGHGLSKSVYGHGVGKGVYGHGVRKSVYGHGVGKSVYGHHGLSVV